MMARVCHNFNREIVGQPRQANDSIDRAKKSSN